MGRMVKEQLVRRLDKSHRFYVKSCRQSHVRMRVRESSKCCRESSRPSPEIQLNCQWPVKMVEQPEVQSKI